MAVRTDADPESAIAAGRSWIRALLLDDFVVLDTETTGLGYADEVIEIGLVGPDGATRFSSMVRPRAGRIDDACFAQAAPYIEEGVSDVPTLTRLADALVS